MSSIYIARHGETDWNRAGRYQGRLESTLTERGVHQAEALAEELAGREIGRIFASPLQRTVETARPLAKHLELPIETDDRIIEIGHGVWEGRLREEIERDDAERMRIWREQPEQVAFPAGESLVDVLERWASFEEELIRIAKASGENIAVVTHDALVRIAVLHISGRPLSKFWQPRVVNCGYVRAELRDGKPRLLDECRDVHLAGMIADTSAQAL